MIIDHQIFRLRDGADEAEFLALDSRMQTEVVVFEHGFVRRTTARSRDGRWLVETFWYDEDGAAASMGRDDDVSRSFRALIDPDSLETARFETLE